IQLHQIDQRGAATQKAHIGPLLRRFRLRGGCDRRRLICWTDELESMHRETPALSALADLLNRRNDVGLGAAAADVAAHQPFFVPVSATVSRMPSSSVVRGSIRSECSLPFMRRVIETAPLMAGT